MIRSSWNARSATLSDVLLACRSRSPDPSSGELRWGVAAVEVSVNGDQGDPAALGETPAAEQLRVIARVLAEVEKATRPPPGQATPRIWRANRRRMRRRPRRRLLR